MQLLCMIQIQRRYLGIVYYIYLIYVLHTLINLYAKTNFPQKCRYRNIIRFT